MDLSETQVQFWSKLAVIKIMSVSFAFGAKKAFKNNDVVNLPRSRKLQLQFGATVRVGSGEEIIKTHKIQL